MIFEILEYREEKNDYIARVGDKQIILDPFVSCIFKIEDKDKYIGKFFDDNNGSYEYLVDVFIASELIEVKGV